MGGVTTVALSDPVVSEWRWAWWLGVWVVLLGELLSG